MYKPILLYLGLVMLATGLTILVLSIPGFRTESMKVAQTPESTVATPPATQDVEKYAARLHKDMNNLRIYCVTSNHYEVWTTGGIWPGKWKDAESLEAARKIVDDYYIKWAQNCIGPTPPGRLVEYGNLGWKTKQDRWNLTEKRFQQILRLKPDWTYCTFGKVIGKPSNKVK